MAGKQCLAGDAEILLAALAAEAERAIRPAGFISLNGAAQGVNRSAVGIGPAEGFEGRLGFPSVMRNT